MAFRRLAWADLTGVEVGGGLGRVEGEHVEFHLGLGARGADGHVVAAFQIEDHQVALGAVEPFGCAVGGDYLAGRIIAGLDQVQAGDALWRGVVEFGHQGGHVFHALFAGHLHV